MLGPAEGSPAGGAQPSLAEAYIRNAEETLSVLRDIKDRSNMWLATTKYYCEYFAVYAFLMRLGLRSEIHECTIEAARFLEGEGLLPGGTARLLKKDKQLRMDNQYYLKNRKVRVDCEELRSFVLAVKDRVVQLTHQDISETRKTLTELVGL